MGINLNVTGDGGTDTRVEDGNNIIINSVDSSAVEPVEPTPCDPDHVYTVNSYVQQTGTYEISFVKDQGVLSTPLQLQGTNITLTVGNYLGTFKDHYVMTFKLTGVGVGDSERYMGYVESIYDTSVTNKYRLHFTTYVGSTDLTVLPVVVGDEITVSIFNETQRFNLVILGLSDTPNPDPVWNLVNVGGVAAYVRDADVSSGDLEVVSRGIPTDAQYQALHRAISKGRAYEQRVVIDVDGGTTPDYVTNLTPVDDIVSGTVSRLMTSLMITLGSLSSVSEVTELVADESTVFDTAPACPDPLNFQVNADASVTLTWVNKDFGVDLRKGKILPLLTFTNPTINNDLALVQDYQNTFEKSARFVFVSETKTPQQILDLTNLVVEAFGFIVFKSDVNQAVILLEDLRINRNDIFEFGFIPSTDGIAQPVVEKPLYTLGYSDLEIAFIAAVPPDSGLLNEVEVTLEFQMSGTGYNSGNLYAPLALEQQLGGVDSYGIASNKVRFGRVNTSVPPISSSPTLYITIPNKTSTVRFSMLSVISNADIFPDPPLVGTVNALCAWNGSISVGKNMRFNSSTITQPLFSSILSNINKNTLPISYHEVGVTNPATTLSLYASGVNVLGSNAYKVASDSVFQTTVYTDKITGQMMLLTFDKSQYITAYNPNIVINKDVFTADLQVILLESPLRLEIRYTGEINFFFNVARVHGFAIPSIKGISVIPQLSSIEIYPTQSIICLFKDSTGASVGIADIVGYGVVILPEGHYKSYSISAEKKESITAAKRLDTRLITPTATGNELVVTDKTVFSITVTADQVTAPILTFSKLFGGVSIGDSGDAPTTYRGELLTSDQTYVIYNLNFTGVEVTAGEDANYVFICEPSMDGTFTTGLGFGNTFGEPDVSTSIVNSIDLVLPNQLQVKLMVKNTTSRFSASIFKTKKVTDLLSTDEQIIECEGIWAEAGTVKTFAGNIEEYTAGTDPTLKWRGLSSKIETCTAIGSVFAEHVTNLTRNTTEVDFLDENRGFNTRAKNYRVINPQDLAGNIHVDTVTTMLLFSTISSYGYIKGRNFENKIGVKYESAVNVVTRDIAVKSFYDVADIFKAFIYMSSPIVNRTVSSLSEFQQYTGDLYNSVGAVVTFKPQESSVANTVGINALASRIPPSTLQRDLFIKEIYAFDLNFIPSTDTNAPSMTAVVTSPEYTAPPFTLNVDKTFNNAWTYNTGTKEIETTTNFTTASAVGIKFSLTFAVPEDFQPLSRWAVKPVSAFDDGGGITATAPFVTSGWYQDANYTPITTADVRDVGSGFGVSIKNNEGRCRFYLYELFPQPLVIEDGDQFGNTNALAYNGSNYDQAEDVAIGKTVLNPTQAVLYTSTFNSYNVNMITLSTMYNKTTGAYGITSDFYKTSILP